MSTKQIKPVNNCISTRKLATKFPTCRITGFCFVAREITAFIQRFFRSLSFLVFGTLYTISLVSDTRKFGDWSLDILSSCNLQYETAADHHIRKEKKNLLHMIALICLYILFYICLSFNVLQITKEAITKSGETENLIYFLALFHIILECPCFQIFILNIFREELRRPTSSFLSDHLLKLLLQQAFRPLYNPPGREDQT